MLGTSLRQSQRLVMHQNEGSSRSHSHLTLRTYPRLRPANTPCAKASGSTSIAGVMLGKACPCSQMRNSASLRLPNSALPMELE